MTYIIVKYINCEIEQPFQIISYHPTLKQAKKVAKKLARKVYGSYVDNYYDIATKLPFLKRYFWKIQTVAEYSDWAVNLDGSLTNNLVFSVIGLNYDENEYKKKYDIVISDLDLVNSSYSSEKDYLCKIGDLYPDDIRCVEYYKAAIRRNSRYARFALGLYYHSKKQFNKAISCFRLAGNLGDPNSIYLLADIYKNDIEDKEKADYYMNIYNKQISKD